MEVLDTVLLALLVLDAIALTVLVLLQQGKGADVGAAFGSGASNTVFGSAGAGTFLSRMTAWLAVGFFAIAFGLAYTAKQRVGTHVIEGLPVVPVESAPVAGQPMDAPELTPEPESVDSGLPDV
ncbi:MAG: preprotein translocase subunit SecG [Pseudomonadales bacterium]|nr:preprotein translocase subunit SecG [Pseudomonadales bacterium]